jgi:hypothetical protein
VGVILEGTSFEMQEVTTRMAHDAVAAAASCADAEGEDGAEGEESAKGEEKAGGEEGAEGKDPPPAVTVPGCAERCLSIATLDLG